jgi:hypothetical protein
VRHDAIPVPKRMAHLDRDARGLPAPVIVMRDTAGSPIFAANDEHARQRCFDNDLCHICGQRLHRGRWFVGGHLSACAEHGAFMDGGLHGECAHYALQVCPYMAAPNYGRLVGPAMLAKSDRRDVLTLADETAGNSRPEFFIALLAVGQVLNHRSVIIGVRETMIVRTLAPRRGTVRRVEVWRHGVQITDEPSLAAIRRKIIGDLMAISDAPRADVMERWP